MFPAVPVTIATCSASGSVTCKVSAATAMSFIEA